jgi:putative MATE family efflux protein
MPTAALGGALRGAGIVKPHLLISVLTVLLNAVLAPFLIAGWGEISGLGVRGAGLATSISVAIGVVAFCWYLRRHEPYLLFDAGLMRPRTHQWRRIFGVGLPAACEFVLVFLSTAVVYYAIRNFGAAVQAGFGIGARALQLLLLPGMALSFAAGPVVAQSFGAARAERVKQTFRIAMLLQGAVSLVITLWIQWRARVVADVFQVDAEVVGVAAVFLQIVSWNMVAQGVVYVCSSTFQGLGNTIPSLVSSSVRFAIFTISVAWLAARSTFAVEQVWYVLIVSVTAQALLSLWLVRGELRRRLVLPLRTPQASAVPSHQRTVMR